MTPNAKIALLTVTSLVVWLVAVWALGKLTRPRAPKAWPATPQLRTEPPAVVNLLVNRGRTTNDAARATLLDLAARHIIEIYQPGNDPLRPAVRITVRTPTGLRPYQQRVFDRLRAAVPDSRLVPLATVADAYAREGRMWWGSFRREVRADARAAGLTDNSWFSWSTVAMMMGAAWIAMLVASLVFLPALPARTPTPADPANQSTPAWSIGLFGCVCSVVLLGLVLFLFWYHDFEGFTDAGKAATGQWLGVQAWLRAHEGYGDTPAAGVMVWDQYISYGVALGTNPVAAAAVDLRTGRKERTWSPHGGEWRRVTVTHPRQFASFGVPATLSIGWAVVAVPVWSVAAWLAWTHRDAGGWLLVAFSLVAVWRVLRNVYLAARGVFDLIAPATVIGTLLSLRPNRPESPPARQTAIGISTKATALRAKAHRVWLRAVVDDGRSDTLRPWLVREADTAHVLPGQPVVLVGQRFGRYARSITLGSLTTRQCG